MDKPTNILLGAFKVDDNKVSSVVGSGAMTVMIGMERLDHITPVINNLCTSEAAGDRPLLLFLSRDFTDNETIDSWKSRARVVCINSAYDPFSHTLSAAAVRRALLRDHSLVQAHAVGRNIVAQVERSALSAWFTATKQSSVEAQAQGPQTVPATD